VNSQIYGGVGGHVGRHIGLASNLMVQCHFYGLNVFLDPENIGIDTNIINFELIVINLWPHEGFDGHLGRHLENKLFLGSDFGKLLVCYKVH